MPTKMQMDKEYFFIYFYIDIYTTSYSHLPATWHLGMV